MGTTFTDIPIDPARTRRFQALSALCGVFAVLVGSTALIGWLLGNEGLKGAWANGIVIKTNTAVALLLAGVALILLGPESAGRARRSIGNALAAIVALIGLATLSQHVFGWNLGIDQLLFHEPPGASSTVSPNRMGLPASTCFPLIGGALLLLGRRRGERAPWGPPALAVILIVLIPLLGYVFNVREMYGIARFTGIALHTAFTLMLLGLGVLWADPTRGAMRRFAAEDSAGLMLRRLMPAAVLLPIALGWLRAVGQERGYYDNEFGRTLLVLAFIVVFSVLIWLASSGIRRQSRARARAEAAELELRDRMVEVERNARAAAEAANRSKDQFLATLSHELRTPLNTMLGWAAVLTHGARSEGDLERGLEAIERNARLQAKLVEDLLETSRIVSGTLRLELQEVDLPAVIEASVAAIVPAASNRRLSIERDIDPAAGPVRGDPARLQQVLWNLLSNAVAFTPAGGRVRVSLVRVGAGVEVAVTDNGVGITPELLEHVFERFRQGDATTTRKHGGLGLGLAIARQLAELHGGRLRAVSAGLGKGASFILELPIAERDSLAVTGPRESAAAPNPPADALAGVRVLVVDDQPDARELIERILAQRRASVVLAEGAARALDLLDRDGFDVLVSDIAMPGRDGIELISDVRARRIDLPAIALTAFARPEDAERALRSGFQIHLAKPLDPETLIAAIAELVAARNRRG